MAGSIPNELIKKHQASRNVISKEIFDDEHRKSTEVVNKCDSKRFDWKRNMSTKVTQPPIFEELALSFENLYIGDPNDVSKIDELNTEVSDPNLDSPITIEEMNSALNQMK